MAKSSIKKDQEEQTQDGNPVVDDLAQGLRIDPETSDEEAILDADAQAGGGEARAQAKSLDVTGGEEEEEEGQAPIPGKIERFQPKEVPPRKPTKKEQKEERDAERQQIKTPTTLPKSVGGLRELVPGAEKIKIHLRKPDGKRGLLGVFGLKEIPPGADAETFAYQVLRPRFGGGHYEFTLVDGQRREFEGGDAEILDLAMEGSNEVIPSSGPNALSLVRDFMMQDREERQRRTRELENLRSRPEKDPIEMLEKMKGLQDKFEGGSRRENEGTLAALIQTMGQQTQAFMEMMARQQAKAEDRMVTLLATLGDKEDKTMPIMLTLLTKLFEEKKSSSSGVLPPAPPPPDPTTELKNLAEVVHLLQPPKDSSGDRMLEYLIAREKEEKLTPKDIIALFNEARGERGTDDFKKSLDNFQFMMQALQNFRQQVEPGATSGFFDALGALFSNRDFASSIAGAIRTKTAMTQSQMTAGAANLRLASGVTPTAEQQARIFEIRRLAQANERLQAKNEDLNEELRRRQPPVQQPPAPRPQQPSVQQPPAPTTVAEAVAQKEIEEAAAAATENYSAVVEKVKAQRGGTLPELPPNIVDHVNNIVIAVDDAELIESVTRLLLYLAELPDWKKFADTVFALTQNNEKTQVLQFIKVFFDTLVLLKLIVPEVTTNVLRAFDEHFDIVVDQVRKASGLEEENGEDEEDEEDEEEEEDEEDLNSPDVS